MADDAGTRRGTRWNSFVGESDGERVRGLHEQGNPAHRVRVEHDGRTLFVHLSDEDGAGWTVLAVDRETRRWAVDQGRAQRETAAAAYHRLHRDDPVD